MPKTAPLQSIPAELCSFPEWRWRPSREEGAERGDGAPGRLVPTDMHSIEAAVSPTNLTELTLGT